MSTNSLETTTEVAVFFYGSFMAREVLAEVNYRPRMMRVARLDGFDIAVRPLATLTRSNDAAAWGILTLATHHELDRLYNREWVRSYRPEAVTVRTLDGAIHPALCYIASGATADRPRPDYLGLILSAARGFGFPESYVKRLEALR